MDILTLSIGGADGWTEGTSAVVASKIAASGKIVTIGAGNDVGNCPFGRLTSCADEICSTRDPPALGTPTVQEMVSMLSLSHR